MTVQYEQRSIFLNGALDTKSDPKAVPADKLADVYNGEYLDYTSVSKREGFEALGHLTYGTLASGLADVYQLASSNNELIALSDNKLFSYVESSQTWKDQGPISQVKTDLKIAARNTSEQTLPDMATVDGVTCYAWTDSTGGLRYQVEDSETGAVLVYNTLISTTGSRVKVISCASNFHICYFDSTSTSTLKIKVIAASNVAGTKDNEPVTCLTDLNNSQPNYDITQFGDENVCVYYADDGLFYITYIVRSGAVGGPENGLPSRASVSTPLGTEGAVSVNATEGNRFIVLAYSRVFSGNYSIIVRVRDAFFGDLGIDQIFASGAEAVTNVTVAWENQPTSGQAEDFYTAWVWWEVAATDSWNHRVECHAFDTLDLNQEQFTFRHFGIASKAFSRAGRVFCNLVHDSPLQATYALARNDHVYFARVLTGEAGGLRTIPMLPQVSSLGDDQYVWAATYKERLLVGTDVTDTFSGKGIKTCTYDFSPAAPYQVSSTGDFGRTLYIPGGYLQTYDGSYPTEAGFHLYPENVSLSQSAGGVLPAGTYSYWCHWDYRNAYGEREISTVASGVGITTTVSGQQVTLTVPTLDFTNRDGVYRANATLAVYRTITNGSTYYRIDNPSSPTYNSTTEDTITFVDNNFDSSITDNELDYLNAQVDNTAAQPGTVLARSQNRLFISGGEHSNRVYYSKTGEAGYAARFFDGFYFDLDQEGGPVTAMAAMDGNLIIFKEHRIFILQDGGFNNLGGGEDYFPPRLISSDVGCINARSVVSTNVGLLFQSAKGFYVLSRNLMVQDIGEGVYRYREQNITGAVQDPAKKQVIFLTDEDRTLVFNTEFGKWSTWNIKGQAITKDESTGLLCFVRESDNKVLRQSADTFTDGGQSYALRLETPWIVLRGLQGRQRVRWISLIGSQESEHRYLRVDCRYDFKDGYIVTKQFDPNIGLDAEGYGDEDYDDGPYGGSGDDVYRVRFRSPQGRCHAIKLVIYDVPGSTQGQSYKLDELNIELGYLPGSAKLGPKKTI